MLINFHSQATTTPKTRAEIQASDEPARVLAELCVTSRTVVWVFVEQFWFEFVAVFHCLQGRLAAQG